MDRDLLLQSIERFPASSGVYLMKDAAGKLLYIGKAVNLRSRVRSYFTDGHEERPQIPHMLRRLDSVEWIATGTPLEAMILEANLIRANKPPYNIDLKDDKHYPYLKITWSEPFPRLLVARRVVDDGSKYFGPYTEAAALKRIVHFARRAFTVRDCSRKLPLRSPVRPCINHAMGRCSGACAGLIQEDVYRAGIAMLERFLLGRRKELLDELRRRMEQASAALAFEDAALLRDQIRLIEEASRSQHVDLKLPDMDCDVFGLCEQERRACAAILNFREGILIAKRQYFFDREAWGMEQDGRDHIVLQYYLDTVHDLPGQLLLPAGAGFDRDCLQQWFDSRGGRKVDVVIPEKGAKRRLVELAEKNARLSLAEKPAPVTSEAAESLRQSLGLPGAPLSIEAFDISNIGGSFAVAGMVRFVNGMPDKSGYRRYKIRTVQGQDDFAMLKEAVTRRMTRAETAGKTPADLFLIDGGKGQLGVVIEALRPFTHAPGVIALAKEEEVVFTPGRPEPVRLPPTDPGRRLLQRIRDEVHRWAITYHRKLRGGQFGRSVLEELPGVGPSTARRLLRAFGSLARLKTASVEEIAALKGFTAGSAQKLKELLQSL